MSCTEEYQRVFCYNVVVRNVVSEEGFEIEYVKRLCAPGSIYKNDVKAEWPRWDGEEYVEKTSSRK